MKMIEITVPVFQDDERFYQETEVIRKGKKITLVGKFFLKEDRYYVSKERAKELEEKGIAKVVKEEKDKTIEAGE